jgi:hypothetical protein
MGRVSFLAKAFGLVSLALAVGTFTGCGGGSSSSWEQCQVANVCGSSDYTLSACCTSAQCYYKTSDGQDFPCAGTNCSAAAQEAASWCVSQ